MSEEKQEAPKYVVHHAEHSAIGDHANVNNYLPATAAATDAGVAELRRLFEQINQRLAALEEMDRQMIAPAVEQTVQATAAIQGGDKDPKWRALLEQRLNNIYAMSNDIGQVLITTLASPPAGVALMIQKIAQKAREDLNLDEAEGDISAESAG